MSDKSATDEPCYYCARYHNAGPGAWCVRGPDGFEMAVSNLDRSIGIVIANLLSGQFDAAKAKLDEWCAFKTLERAPAYDQAEECLRIWHGDGDHGWRVLKHQWPEAAINEQRRKMWEVIKRVRDGW
jgi:hypothetical protein